ncbi:MAG: MBL fold metallo-hydrolase [Clostridiales bacterium]|jgi:glyoxylase-like metal-dependent hydrolase (beta-lactamase superfamily II)|nr:MBL fold metallo-hydrolase [Clostridiales bacterium]
MGYYKTYDLGNGVYTIHEMLGVGCALILGKEKALLIDTGYGFGNLRKEVTRLSKGLPLVVVNTHAHCDHCYGNSQFEEVYVHPADIPSLEGGKVKEQYDMMMGYASKKAPFVLPLLAYGKLRPKPKFKTKIKPLDFSELDLGGRVVRFMEFPGHTPGSVMVLDEATKTIFAGDAVNAGIFLFFDEGLKLSAYASRLDELAKLKGYDFLRISHSTEQLPFGFVAWNAGFIRRIEVAKCEKTDFPPALGEVLLYQEQGPYGDCKAFLLKGQIG